MSTLSWYWHRLAIMSPLETALHARRRLRQLADSGGPRVGRGLALGRIHAFPQLPEREAAPAILRTALRRDTERAVAGRWRAFAHLEIDVDTPPRWQKDYLAGRDVATSASAFRLDHRELPGADIRLIWELSRWLEAVRLAMAAYVLDDEAAADVCLGTLENWVEHNPPYCGWNWTSALEAGLRLVQFTWIDACLLAHARVRRPAGALVKSRLLALRRSILPAHVWFTRRHRSFGSSANNHLLGELAGLILATVRWPGLRRTARSLDALQRRWEREALAQFAEDGGNREQALHYQLFSWELCWQTRAALRADGRAIPQEVDERLHRAAQFYVDVQVPSDPWEYGDSDNARVTPFFADDRQSIAEWHRWMAAPSTSPAIDYWWAADRAIFGSVSNPSSGGRWVHYRDSGQAVWRRGAWTARLDASPLGYLKTAAHAHLDALHLSVWVRGVALIVDPGTGCYYADPQLREWLASRAAHNAPVSGDAEWPRRRGPFLWTAHHPRPVLAFDGDAAHAAVRVGNHRFERIVRPVRDTGSIEVEDRCSFVGESGEESRSFVVCWQFGPDATLEQVGPRTFRVARNTASMDVALSDDWAEVCPVTVRGQHLPPPSGASDSPTALAGTVSAAFRKIEWAPFLRLVATVQPGRRQVFRTTLLLPRSS